jgi:hypothetical protein
VRDQDEDPADPDQIWSIAAGFRIERFEEPGERDYPVPIGLRAVR